MKERVVSMLKICLFLLIGGFLLSAICNGQRFMQLNYGSIHRCRDCSTVTVQSMSGNLTRHHVPGAAKVLRMRLTKNLSSTGRCVLGISYGFVGSDAWVDLGCHGEFEICYVEGSVQRLECSCDEMRPRTCHFKEDCPRLETVTLVKATSDIPCIPGYSYRRSASSITVTKGCQAVFDVGCRTCTNR